MAVQEADQDQQHRQEDQDPERFAYHQGEADNLLWRRLNQAQPRARSGQLR